MADDIELIPADLLALATPDELKQYRNYLIGEAVKADDWASLLPALAPQYASVPFADHHKRFWNWVWSIESSTRPAPFVGIWPRGGAKSTSAEMAVMVLGARRKRGYCLYVSETQDQADDHVANIAALLESEEVGVGYPELGERMMSKFGTSKGWRRNRIRTSTGFTIDAVGLDSAARGIKLESMRPDLMVFDDIDGESDSANTTDKKIRTITRKLIPAGSGTIATIAIQNKVHDDSIFAQLADGRADFLNDRIVSGPIPAVWNLEWEEQAGRFIITGGQAAWPEGQSLVTCQANVNDWGLTAFLAEAQHSTVPPTGGMFDHIPWASIRVTEAQLPIMRRTTVWLDPAVTSTDQSDSQGIQCDGLGQDGLVYRLWSWEGRTTPLDAVKRALVKAIEWESDVLGIETDQGGDTWRTVYDQACEILRKDGVLSGSAPRYAERKGGGSAGNGGGAKSIRAQRMLVDYERNRFRHLEGTSGVLEKALTRFPKSKPFDLVDSAYWSWWELVGKVRRKTRTRSAANVSLGVMSYG